MSNTPPEEGAQAGQGPAPEVPSSPPQEPLVPGPATAHGTAPASHSGRAGRHSARPWRRWPRRTLIGINIFVLLCLIAVGSAYGYVRYKLDGIATDPSSHVTRVGYNAEGGKLPKKDWAHGLKPENILLIGDETRQGLTPAEQTYLGSSAIYSGNLADIMMILHLDPATRTASILSIPRDLFVPMPAGSPVGDYQKLDAALNDGDEGPNNLVAAVQDDLGIPINHFIELNFNGFMNSVDALGGIDVYFPRPVWDPDSLLYVAVKGCHYLNGVEALELVRARHLRYEPAGVKNEPRDEWPQEPESDLARIVRTHTFIKLVAAKARTEYSNPIRMNDFLSAILAQITIDSGLKGELLKIAETYAHINLNLVSELTLPTTEVPTYYYYSGEAIGDVVFPVQPTDDNVINEWDADALPTPVRPAAVQVVSIAGSYYAATDAGQALESDGLRVTSESVGEEPSSTSETLVLYHQGTAEAPDRYLAQAMDVMKYLSGAVMLQPSSTVPAGTVTVELGSTVDVKAHPVPATTTTSPPGTATTGPVTTTSAPATTRPATPTTSSAPTTTRPKPTTTTVPTPGGVAPSSASDVLEPWDPRACPAGSPVIKG